MRQGKTDRTATLEAMRDMIGRRMETRHEDWTDHDRDPMFDRLRAKYSLPKDGNHR